MREELFGDADDGLRHIYEKIDDETDGRLYLIDIAKDDFFNSVMLEHFSHNASISTSND